MLSYRSLFLFFLTISFGVASKANNLQCTDYYQMVTQKTVVDKNDNDRFHVKTVLGNYKMAYRDEIPEPWNGLTYILNPGLSESSSFFDLHALALLKLGYRVVRLEPFNVGRTLEEQGTPIEGLGLEKDATAQAEIIKNLNLKPMTTILVGHSRGGATSLIINFLLGPGFFKRVYLSNSYYRWLPELYKEKVSSQLLAWTRLIHLFNPASYMPVTASIIDHTMQNWSKINASLGVDLATGLVNFETVVRKHIERRSAKNNSGLAAPLLVAGIMAQYNAMKASSVETYAQMARIFSTDVRIGIAKYDPLVPPSATEGLSKALGVSSVTTLPGGHMMPLKEIDKFLAWITEPN